MQHTIIVSSAMGIEKVTANEMRHLGFSQASIKNGMIQTSGTASDIALLNFSLRTAERVYVQAASFKAEDFDELYEHAREVNWKAVLPPRANTTVNVQLKHSRINSARHTQSIIKRAIIDSIAGKNSNDTIDESGPKLDILASIDEDTVRILLDSTGAGLHKRGYRKIAGEAPLRETTAAAMLLLNHQFGKKPLWDPFCGSGTIAIEAALLQAGTPPGAQRSFAFMHWPHITKNDLNEARENAAAKLRACSNPAPILASDLNPEVLAIAKQNAANAGVAERITFFTADARTVTPRGEPGLLLCNPPYGVRLTEDVSQIYADFGRQLKQFHGWNAAVLTALPNPEKLLDLRYTKNRKIYNGQLKCYMYTLSIQ